MKKLFIVSLLPILLIGCGPGIGITIFKSGDALVTGVAGYEITQKYTVAIVNSNLVTVEYISDKYYNYTVKNIDSLGSLILQVPQNALNFELVNDSLLHIFSGDEIKNIRPISIGLYFETEISNVEASCEGYYSWYDKKSWPNGIMFDFYNDEKEKGYTCIDLLVYFEGKLFDS